MKIIALYILVEFKGMVNITESLESDDKESVDFVNPTM